MLLMAVATFWSFEVPDVAAFQVPGMARVFLWHFPCPMLAVILFFGGAWSSIRIFKRISLKPFVFQTEEDPYEILKWDVKAVAAMELAYIFCLLTMATGILFSELQWKAWWSWDPRQTSFAIVLVMYAAYFALRLSFSDPAKRAANSAAYALASLLPGLFLIFVFPRLPQVISLHPSNSIMAGLIKGEYAQCVLLILFLMCVLTVYLYRIRVRTGLIELELEKNDANLAISGGSPTPTGVVRPVSLHD